MHKKIKHLVDTVNLCTARAACFLQPTDRLGLIYGGTGNLGDDAMAEAARQLLPDFQLLRFMHPKQENRLSRLNLSGRRYFKSVILGGGTLICPTWSKEAKAALHQGLPVWSLGTGVGSSGFDHATEVDLKEWLPLLADFRRIGLRGPRSQATLTALGISQAEVIGDLALSLAKPQAQPSSDPPKIAVNVTTPGGQDYRGSQYASLQELETVLPVLIKAGWELVPVAMHPGDIAPLSYLLHRISMGHLAIASPIYSKDFFELVAGCRFTVAVRLHAAVLSCCVGVPPLMLGYRDKCLDFMESMHLEQWHVSLQNAQPLEIGEKLLYLSEMAMDLRPDVMAQANVWKKTIESYVAETLSQVH